MVWEALREKVHENACSWGEEGREDVLGVGIEV
jgi:hypothetical protein